MRARSPALRTPACSSARAKACEPRISAPIRRRSNASDPEKRSKISEGPVSNLPPHSFMCFVSGRPERPPQAGSLPHKKWSCGLGRCQRGPHLDRQAGQVDEAQCVLLVVRSAHGETRDIQRGSEEHTSELQSPCNLVCRLLLEKKHT